MIIIIATETSQKFSTMNGAHTHTKRQNPKLLPKTIMKTISSPKKHLLSPCLGKRTKEQGWWAFVVVRKGKLCFHSHNVRRHNRSDEFDGERRWVMGWGRGKILIKFPSLLHCCHSIGAWLLFTLFAAFCFLFFKGFHFFLERKESSATEICATCSLSFRVGVV